MKNQFVYFTDLNSIMEKTYDIAGWLTLRLCKKLEIVPIAYYNDMTQYTEQAQAIFDEYYDQVELLVIKKYNGEVL